MLEATPIMPALRADEEAGRAPRSIIGTAEEQLAAVLELTLLRAKNRLLVTAIRQALSTGHTEYLVRLSKAGPMPELWRPLPKLPVDFEKQIRCGVLRLSDEGPG